MLLHRLILENFGLFRGRVEIDLLPRQKYRKTRPVVLVGGTNGAGKTTILDAIRLCLYGPLALGERVSQDEYQSYLRSSIHRSEALLIKPRGASVGLEFDYGIAGKLHRFVVERSWERHGNAISTFLTVKRDGQPLDELEQAHADDFLRDLIPVGVSQLFFFDGEKIQKMAQAADDDAALSEAIRELLGLDIVSRLHSDLSIYATRLKASSAPASLRKEFELVEKDLAKLDNERLAAVRALDQAHAKADAVRGDIATIERKLSRTGGKFANRREELKAEEAQLNAALCDTEREIRELCSDLLPFLLAGRLCASLKEQLLSEEKIQAWQIHQSQLKRRLGSVKRSLDKAIFANGGIVKLGDSTKQAIIERVRSILDGLTKAPTDLTNVPLVHELSEQSRRKTLSALDRVMSDMPMQIKKLELRYDKQFDRLRTVRASIDQIPADEVLQPLMKRLNALHQKLGNAEAAEEQAKSQLQALDHKMEVSRRAKRQKEQAVQEATASSERRDLVAKVQAVLDEYGTALTESKVEELGAAVVDCFQRLWRKGDLVHDIKVDPKTCSVVLFDSRGQIIPKDRLSAGEKQIYAIAMLWALARVSGRVLPMVIDTPLARLDDKHRHHLVTRYFPEASHQVIILSTDTEIDQRYFNELGLSLSHTYHLAYDEVERRTLVQEGYFWGRRHAEVEG